MCQGEGLQGPEEGSKCRGEGQRRMTYFTESYFTRRGPSMSRSAKEVGNERAHVVKEVSRRGPAITRRGPKVSRRWSKVTWELKA